MEFEGSQVKLDMVASLQSRKDALEAKIKENNEELKALCVQEAELTGALPPETPLEAGESPPVFRRRVGTVFTYPENLINKLKSKEEESLATLELEYNIQSGIAEAARTLANDGTVSKAARRKHRLAYQQSERRLLDLEARLDLLRRSHSSCPLKQRKKPRPPLHSEMDSLGGSLGGDMMNGVSLSPVQDKLYPATAVANKHHHHQQHQQQQEASLGRGTPPHSYSRNSNRQPQCEVVYPPNWPHQAQPLLQPDRRPHPHPHQHQHQHPHPHQHQHPHQGNRYKEVNNWYNTAPTSRCLGVTDEEREKSVRYRDRFGSLDRPRGGGGGGGGGQSGVDCVDGPRHCPPPPPPPPLTPPTVLLPNQTYPENSLMRTQSLGMVDHSGRKSKEKDWYETSLDAAPRHTPTPPASLAHTPVPPHPPHPHPPHPPASQQISFDTVVPFESPKNHTVVQAGMWQPYREVTKPFEMADFYKYSTKFRKNTSGAPPVPQQKAAYQPLQPQTCQPLAPQPQPQEGGSGNGNAGGAPVPTDGYSTEMIAWYQEHSVPQTRSATLV